MKRTLVILFALAFVGVALVAPIAMASPPTPNVCLTYWYCVPQCLVDPQGYCSCQPECAPP